LFGIYKETTAPFRFTNQKGTENILELLIDNIVVVTGDQVLISQMEFSKALSWVSQS
jgi:hypothetical protein